MSPTRVTYHYSTMLTLAAMLLGILGVAFGTRDWALAGLTVLCLLLLLLLVPKARRQRASRR